MRAPASATASAVWSSCVSDSTAQGPAITTKSSPPISISRTWTTLRSHAALLATRSKQENCPFHFGFIGGAILVRGACAITSRNALEHAKTAGFQCGLHSHARVKFFVCMKNGVLCDLNHTSTRRDAHSAGQADVLHTSQGRSS